MAELTPHLPTYTQSLLSLLLPFHNYYISWNLAGVVIIPRQGGNKKENVPEQVPKATTTSIPNTIGIGIEPTANKDSFFSVATSLLWIYYYAETI